MASALQLCSISAGVTTSAGLGLLGLGDSPLGCSVLFPAGAALGVPAIKPLSQAECCNRGRWPRGVGSEYRDRLGAGMLLPCPQIGDAVGAALQQTRALPAARGGEELALLLALPRQRWARRNPTCRN